MRKLKEIIRLKFESELSVRQIAAALNLSIGVIAKYIRRAEEQGIQWPLPSEMSDAELSNTLQQQRGRKAVGNKERTSLDCPVIQKELTQKSVTLQLLWEEYIQLHPDSHYSYPQYCLIYRKWRGKQKLSMRQTHRAGEKLFVDYCGPTMSVVNPQTGEIRSAQIFVAVLGASSYTYAEATWSQTLADWIGSHVRTFEFMGGVPAVIVPDNLKSAVTKACRYEPELNLTYQQLAEHYSVAVIPARPYKPKDKAKAEAGVLLVERWIMMRLRKHTFYTLAALNQVIHTLLDDLNQRQFQKRNDSRLSLFELLDKPALKPLPSTPYEYSEIKKARVHLDYHVEYDGHYYSVPYQLVKEEVFIYAGVNVVRVRYGNKIVANHPRSFAKSGHTTDLNHMAKAHRKHQEWTPSRFISWAESIGPQTRAVIEHQLHTRPHPEHGYRSCMGILNLVKRYPTERLEAACQRAHEIGALNYKNIRSILRNGMDKLPTEEEPKQSTLPLDHDNVRGSDYYH
jgi:transposase